MALAVRLRKQGGPEVMALEEVQVPPPGPGEATLRHTAVGLNFIDVYQRSGHYALQLPSGLGQEAAGVVTAVAPGVTTVRVGERVAYAGAPLGAYAEARDYPADRLVPVPEGVSDEAAAASLLKGLTAWYLVRRTYQVERGQTVLVHAAAGGRAHPLSVAPPPRGDGHRHRGERGQAQLAREAGAPTRWSSTGTTGASSRRR
jgi:NADPH2:quinone reductase